MDEAKKDLKNEVIDVVDEPTSTGQEEKPKKETKSEDTKVEEDVDSLPSWAKARLEKAESDKESYKKGMLKYEKKTKEFSLTEKEKKKEKVEEEETPEWNETSKKFQKQTLDEARKIARKEATQSVEESNEKKAVSQFLKKNPELEEKWDDIVSNYYPKNGKDTVDSIMKDLNRAHVLTLHESGDLEKLQSEASKKGEKKGAAQAKLAELSSVSKTTSKAVSKESGLSASAIAMAERMRVDPKEVAKEDDSSTAEIKF